MKLAKSEINQRRETVKHNNLFFSYSVASFLIFAVLGTTLQAQQAATPPAPDQDLERRISNLEDRLELALELKDDRINQIQILFNIVAGIGGLILLFLAFRDTLQRRAEHQRQEKFDQRNLAGIESVNKVIAAVSDALKFAAEQQKTVEDTLSEIQKSQDFLRKQQENQFNLALSIVQPFLQLTRMDLPTLSMESMLEGERLRSLVASMGQYLEDHSDRAAVGDLYYWSGVLAIYADAVADAKRYLVNSSNCVTHDHEIRVVNDSKYRFRIAFTYHFLAILEKNWGSLDEALHFIDKAADSLESKPGELLTPVTRAEILAYIPGKEKSARAELTRLVDIMRDLDASSGAGNNLDDNQKNLRDRIWLLLGNIDFKEQNYGEASSLYAQILDHSPKMYYARFALGECKDRLGRQDEARHEYKSVLKAIEASGDLARKREVVTRGSIAAIAALAAQLVGDKGALDKYKREVDGIVKRKWAVGGMSPRFFAPWTKGLVGPEEVSKKIEELRILA